MKNINYELTAQQEKAAIAVLDMLDIIPNGESWSDFIAFQMRCDYLTFNVGRDGNEYAYYLDSARCGAVCVDTLLSLTDEQIEKNFC